MRDIEIRVYPSRSIRKKKAKALSIRPKRGLAMICIAGLLISWMPFQLAWLSLVPGTFTWMGLMVGLLILSLGMVGWFFPHYIKIIGFFSIILSILSLIGALGGLFIGMVLGIIGGGFCLAWKAPSSLNE
jgi:Family of unknown function (DUF6114)